MYAQLELPVADDVIRHPCRRKGNGRVFGCERDWTDCVQVLEVGPNLVKVTSCPEILSYMYVCIRIIEEYSAKRGSSPIWFISRKMAKQDFVYHCWQWLAVTLKWLLHMLWISHHYETFTECRNEDSVAEIDTNSIFMIWWLNPLLDLYSSISV